MKWHTKVWHHRYCHILCAAVFSTSRVNTLLFRSSSATSQGSGLQATEAGKVPSEKTASAVFLVWGGGEPLFQFRQDFPVLCFHDLSFLIEGEKYVSADGLQ